MRMQDHESFFKSTQDIKPTAEAKIHVMILVLLSILAYANKEENSYFPLFPLKNCQNPVCQFEKNCIYFPYYMKGNAFILLCEVMFSNTFRHKSTTLNQTKIQGKKPLSHTSCKTSAALGDWKLRS